MAGRADTPAMVTEPVGFEQFLREFEGALWTGEMLIAGGRQVDVFPDELDDLTAVFFQLFRPTAQA